MKSISTEIRGEETENLAYSLINGQIWPSRQISIVDSMREKNWKILMILQ